MKAFLGMGLLGSNFVKAMRRRGEEVQVWNRTAAKAQALENDGAKAFEEVSEAVKGADVIHLTLKDDATVDEVLEKASAGFKPGAVIYDHTTTSVEGAKKRTADWGSKGITYLHAPVFMGPPNALESTGFMLVSGDQAIIAKAEPELSKMTGKLLNLGAETGKASGMKLTGNLFLLTLTAGISDTLAMAKGLGISGEEFDKASWELSMARKDAGLMLKEAEQSGAHLTVIPAIAAEMDRWIAKGYGDKDWSVIAKDNI